MKFFLMASVLVVSGGCSAVMWRMDVPESALLILLSGVLIGRTIYEVYPHD